MPSLAAAPVDPTARGARATCEIAAVLARADALARAARQGAALPALRGKNIGLVSAAPHDGEAALLRCAAAQLGVHVAHVRPSLGEASSAAEVADTARLLGRLYDAIYLPGLSPALVDRVAAAAAFRCSTASRRPTTQAQCWRNSSPVCPEKTPGASCCRRCC
jgi:hypothetical protein